MFGITMRPSATESRPRQSRWTRCRWMVWVLAGWMGLVGCGGDEDGGADAGFDGGQQDAQDLACTGGETVTRLQGVVWDEADQPETDAKVQVCIRVAATGVLRCLSPEDTDAVGTFGVDVPDGLRCMESVALRVLVPGTPAATTYCVADIAGRGPVVEVEAPLVVYATTPPSVLPDAGDTGTERTVVFEDGLELDIVPDRFFGPNLDAQEDYEALAARRLDDIPTEQCFMEGAPAFDGLYAFSPEGDVDGASFPIRIPNATDLAPGASVSLFILGGLSTRLPDETTVPEAEWFEYGTGVVATGGDVIEAELPYFSWLAYRAQ